MMVRFEINRKTLSRVDVLMWRVIKQMIKNKKQILDEFELTCSQYEVLSAIHIFTKSKYEIIQIDLSESTNIDPMTISTILRNLQRKGLVTRIRNMVNTRVVNVEFTPKGVELYEKSSSKIRRSNDLIYKDVDKNLLSIQLLALYDKLNTLNH